MQWPKLPFFLLENNHEIGLINAKKIKPTKKTFLSLVLQKQNKKGYLHFFLLILNKMLSPTDMFYVTSVKFEKEIYVKMRK